MKKTIIIICSVATVFFAANLTSCSSGGAVDQVAVDKMADSLLNNKKTALMDSMHMVNMMSCKDSMIAWGEKMNKKGGGGHTSTTPTKPDGMTTTTTTTTTTTPGKGGGTVTTKGGGTTGTGGTTPVVTHKGDPPKQ